jgi:hypothetical protein
LVVGDPKQLLVYVSLSGLPSGRSTNLGCRGLANPIHFFLRFVLVDIELYGSLIPSPCTTTATTVEAAMEHMGLVVMVMDGEVEATEETEEVMEEMDSITME